MNTEIKTKIKQFLSRYFKNYDLQDGEDIFALGFVNSLFAMQLVLFIEKGFQLTVENEDLKLDNFRTINALTHFIDSKQATVAQAAR